MSSRHRSSESAGIGWRAIGIVIGLVVAVVVVVAVGLNLQSGSEDPPEASDSEGSAVSGQDSGDSECTDEETVEVWAAPDVELVVTELAGAATDCGTYDIRGVASEQALAEMTADDSEIPDMWIPDNSVWTDLANSAGLPVDTGPILATSPVVLAAPQSFASLARQTFNLPEQPSWAELVALPGLPVVVGEPTRDAATLSLLTTASASLEDEATRDALLVAVAQQGGAGDPLDFVKNGQDAFVPTTEQALVEAGADLDVAVLTPAEGIGELNFHLVTLGEPGQAAEDLEAALVSSDAAQVWRDAGLRPGGEDEALGVSGVADASPNQVEVSGEQATALLKQWEVSAPTVRIVALVDISGSMDTDAGGGRSRVQITADAASAAMDSLAPRSQVGVRWFSTGLGPHGRDWIEKAPIRALNDEVDGDTHRDVIRTIIDGLNEDATTGDTGLYDSLADAYRDLVADYDPDFRSSVVVLTDGTNDDPEGGLSEEQLLADLNQMQDDERPVEVLMLGMGPNVDEAPMRRIVEATGGRYASVDDAEDMAPVLVDLIANRPQT
ncbi:MAG: substrate-binding and VWA domain-containing protein [Ornithinimicrobium sp.]